MIKIGINVKKRTLSIPKEMYVPLPRGGDTNWVLSKKSSADFDYKWGPPSGGSGSLPTSVSYVNQTSVHVLHNKGVKPIVDVFDSFGVRVFTTISHPNANEFYVTFAAPQSGSISYF